MSLTEGKGDRHYPAPNEREELRVALSSFKGKNRNREGAEYLPGKGVSILPEHLASVLKAISSACDELGVQQ